MSFALRTWLTVGTLLLGLVASVTGASAEPPGPKKVLILGNSITLHGPAPKIGWTSNWGMAASAPEKDFAHLVLSELTRRRGAAPEAMIQNIAAFERQYATYDLEAKLQEVFAFKADLVILAIGENVPSLGSETAQSQFADAVSRLLQRLAAAGRPTIIVRSCFWPNKLKDQALEKVCRAVSGRFVDISALSKDEANFARSERKFAHAGVAAHPGDRGMQAIANAILAAIKQ